MGEAEGPTRLGTEAWAHAAALLLEGRRAKVSIATDCSGIEAPLEALRQIAKYTELEVQHVCSSDIGHLQKRFILKHHSPLRFFEDMLQRNHSEALPRDVNLYVIGFPCTPWSTRHVKSPGWDHKDCGPFFEALKVVTETSPDIVLLENVHGILRREAAHLGTDARAIDASCGGVACASGACMLRFQTLDCL
jgi:site-specific DNA-cytosine methylase